VRAKSERVGSGEYEALNLPDSTNLRVHDIIKTKTGIGDLLTFAKKTYNEDMVMFAALAGSYEEQSEEWARKKVAKHMVRCYLKVGAEREINISAKLRKGIVARVDGGDTPPDLLKSVQREVEQLMDQNLDSFLDGKRSFWKNKVAWKKDEQSAGEVSVEGQVERTRVKTFNRFDDCDEEVIPEPIVTRARSHSAGKKKREGERGAYVYPLLLLLFFFFFKILFKKLSMLWKTSLTLTNMPTRMTSSFWRRNCIFRRIWRNGPVEATKISKRDWRM
jgi:hypothetical protein